MKPKEKSNLLFAAIRARAKMKEFRADEADYNDIKQNPKSLLPLAIGILGDATAALADKFISPDTESGHPQLWEEEDGSIQEMVRFSALYFDSFLEAQFDQDISNEFSLLCATSYYLSDSIGSCSVVVKRSSPPEIQLGHGLARLAYCILTNKFLPIEEDFAYRDLSVEILGLMDKFYRLEDAGNQLRNICSFLKNSVYSSGSARELLYADIVISLCARKFDNASLNILPPASGLPLSVWSYALLKEGFPIELWPAQRLLSSEGIFSGHSAVIQMPTSAGKTRGIELIIRSHFLGCRSSLAVIIAPFRSLCHDIRSDLVKAFSGENILIDEMSDSYIFDIHLDDIRKQSSVLVVTPEKMLYMLRRAPEFAETIGLAIYDEGHQFDGLTRGPTYELLLASMRISLPREAQVILISAVIGNASQIAEWLIGDKDSVVLGNTLLPTVRNIAFASWQYERAQLKYVSPQDPDAEEFFVPRLVESKKLPRKKSERKDWYFPEKGTTRSNTDIGIFLGLHLVENGSVAIFFGKKESIKPVCERIVDLRKRGAEINWPLEYSDVAEVGKIAKLSELHLGANADTTHASTLGIFCHHSNTPPGLRLSIEHAMKAGLTRMVICTSTLAQGVNFPIRYLIVTSTQQGIEEIKVRDFHNLMGRAGRAGMYTEGNVIFSSPSLIDKKQGDGRWRWENMKRLLDPTNSEPSTSSILDIFSNYRQRVKNEEPIELVINPDILDLTFSDEKHISDIAQIVVDGYPKVDKKTFVKFLTDRARAVQRIAAYLASYVDFESDLASERINELAQNTLAYHLADEQTRQRLLAVFHAAAKAIEGSADLGLIKLFRKSPLPPANIMGLNDWINSNYEQIIILDSVDEFDAAIITEAMNHSNSKSIKSFPSNRARSCLSSWLEGKSYHEILTLWKIEEIKIGRSWGSVEHVVNLCESGFSYDLAMVIAAVADLSEDKSEELNEKLVFLQKRIKYGLPTSAAIAFFEAGFSDRIVSQSLANAFPKVRNKSDVRNLCRYNTISVINEISEFPSYFADVVKELSHK